MLRKLTAIALAACLSLPVVSAADAAPKTDFKVCWSIYVGWMPWGYLADSGIMKKWADKYGINVEIVQINDYVESINQYTAGGFDGCVDDQHGRAVDPGRRRRRHHRADHRRLLQRQRRGDPEGQDRSSSRHRRPEGQSGRALASPTTCWRAALDTVGLAEKDITVVNTSDADMVAAYGTADVTARRHLEPAAVRDRRHARAPPRSSIPRRSPARSST